MSKYVVLSVTEPTSNIPIIVLLLYSVNLRYTLLPARFTVSNARSHVYHPLFCQSSLLIEITEVVLIDVLFVSNCVDVGSTGAFNPAL